MSPIAEGKVVIVTGAGGGIGRDIAIAYAKAGAKVVVNDIGVSLSGQGPTDGPAQAVVEEITAAGGTAIPSTDSVAGYESASQIVQAAMDHFGRIDIVVNNAGNLRDRLFHKMNEEEWRSLMYTCTARFLSAALRPPTFANRNRAPTYT